MKKKKIRQKSSGFQKSSGVQKSSGFQKFQEFPFSVLVEQDNELADLRHRYASESKEERRAAADLEYHAEIANSLFSNVVANIREKDFWAPYWPAGIVALAIDPLYAPAILTVGSIEYQVGRVEEAMKLFLTLTTLPADEEEDLDEIIDKAGNFLIDNDDIDNAMKLYTAAQKAFPNSASYIAGLGYCLGKLGRYLDAAEKFKDALRLEPDNYKFLNDLGYSLLEAERFDEAEQYLMQSIALAPEDYQLARNNLEDLKMRKAMYLNG